jgi:hypothetical protein
MTEQAQHRIYLSGPIAEVGNDLALAWRMNAIEDLSEAFMTVNPLDWAHDYVGNMSGLMQRDIAELWHSSVLLVNFQEAPAKPLLRGTIVELAMWGAWQIPEQQTGQLIHGPVVGVYRDKKQVEKLGPWVTNLTPRTFFSLEDAITWLNLESSTWTIEETDAKQPSDNSPMPSEDTATPPSEILGPNGQALK